MKLDVRAILIVVVVSLLIAVKAACGEGPSVQVMWEHSIKKCYPGYCKIVKARDYATAFSIGKTRGGRYAFLTAGHTFRERRAEPVYLGLGKKWRLCRVEAVSQDDACDLAIVTIEYSGELECHELADSTPEISEVYLRGFSGDSFEQSKANIVDVLPSGVLTFDRASKQGQSGGPVVLTNGHCVGVIKGYQHSRLGVGCHIGVIRPFVVRTFGYVPSCSQPKLPVPPATASPSITHLREIERRLLIIERRLGEIPDVSSLEDRLTRLENRKITVPATVRILSPDGKTIDEDVYQLPDEAIELRLVPTRRR